MAVKRTPTERFWAKFQKDPTGCWIWTGCIDMSGYGRFGQGGRGKNMAAHRWAYMTFVGPIPDGYQLDHLCRVRACVNPAHLEPVTPQENVRRGLNGVLHKRPDECVHGHAYTPENTYIVPTSGTLRCKTCYWPGGHDRLATLRPRGTCAGCGRELALKKGRTDRNGRSAVWTLSKHGSPRCDGSDRPPVVRPLAALVGGTVTR